MNEIEIKAIQTNAIIGFMKHKGMIGDMSIPQILEKYEEEIADCLQTKSSAIKMIINHYVKSVGENSLKQSLIDMAEEYDVNSYDMSLKHRTFPEEKEKADKFLVEAYYKYRFMGVSWISRCFGIKQERIYLALRKK